MVAALLPASFVRALIHDAERRPINASGRHRHPTVRQRRVVKERDRVCVDCRRRDLLEFDHVPDYAQSKRTVVDELQLRCAPCHHRRHSSGTLANNVVAAELPGECADRLRHRATAGIEEGIGGSPPSRSRRAARARYQGSPLE